MVTCIGKVPSEEFGVSRGSRREAKDTWWWNDVVQKAIKEKRRKIVSDAYIWIGVQTT